MRFLSVSISSLYFPNFVYSYTDSAEASSYTCVVEMFRAFVKDILSNWIWLVWTRCWKLMVWCIELMLLFWKQLWKYVFGYILDVCSNNAHWSPLMIQWHSTFNQSDSLHKSGLLQILSKYLWFLFKIIRDLASNFYYIISSYECCASNIMLVVGSRKKKVLLCLTLIVLLSSLSVPSLFV